MNEQLPVIESCDGCGACCREQCSPPFIMTDPEFESLPDTIKQSYFAGLDELEASDWRDAVPCFWYDEQTRRCRHYEYRPEICREFDVGAESCLAWRQHFSIKSSNEDCHAAD